MPHLSSASHNKSLLRFHIRQNRVRQHRLLQGSQVAQGLLASGVPLIEGLAPSSVLAAFLPLNTEPPIFPLLHTAYATGLQVIVPVVKAQRQLAWVEWTPQGTTSTNSLGIAEPTGKDLGAEAFLQADLRLIPALAVASDGARLGQGGGFYDLLTQPLSAPARARTYAVIFDHELLDALPAESHDFRAQAVLTPSGVHKLTSSPLS
ncbi:5-formyltetrahydrofolate cyclo-ligase [Rothia sp. ZJ1223]|uniref:5-formyltetrahydrofolate cyclo-ligase n=1 Tax=Rothia sp. ZJ1223 TaxID=2811098 RepID=UPI00195B9586|nr:5-formyltetrahydrofolate cyclo-ligase [Rothia sp. ZJ1223]MBM7051160.1 5-formyltetrahydrofolate cyclo-ligase [Rothia sp. ZJ1223]